MSMSRDQRRADAHLERQIAAGNPPAWLQESQQQAVEEAAICRIDDFIDWIGSEERFGDHIAGNPEYIRAVRALEHSDEVAIAALSNARLLTLALYAGTRPAFRIYALDLLRQRYLRYTDEETPEPELFPGVRDALAGLTVREAA